MDKISPFKRNIKSQLVKMPKVYFFDLGIRNAILGNFLSADSRQDNGFLFENFIFLELKNKMKNKIFFYRTVSKTEIDFIIDKGEKIILIEAKHKSLTKPIDSRTINGFVSRAGNVDKTAVINLSFNGKDNLIEYADYRFAGKMVDADTIVKQKSPPMS